MRLPKSILSILSTNKPKSAEAPQEASAPNLTLSETKSDSMNEYEKKIAEQIKQYEFVENMHELPNRSTTFRITLSD